MQVNRRLTQQPYVQVQLAFDNWSGKAVHPEKTSEIRDCPAVAAIYPRVKALEIICTHSSMRVVLEHIQAKKAVLDRSAMVSTFGENFVIEHVERAKTNEKMIQTAADKSTRVVVAVDVDEEQVPTKQQRVASERKVE